MSNAPKPNILAPGAVATPCVPSELSAIAMAMIARASIFKPNTLNPAFASPSII
ncbi:TPA: hypothetical protein ACGAYP_000986 [Streptococcus agalactiae]